MRHSDDVKVAPQRIEFQKRAIINQAWSTCLNCDHWSQWMHPSNPVHTCTKYAMVPPPNVIVTGCIEWEGGIPF